MIVYSFYHAETGRFADMKYCSTSEHPENLRNQVPAGHLPIEGDYDHLAEQVDISTGAVIDYQPPAPDANHEWNSAARRWQLTAAVQAAIDQRARASARIAQLEVSQHRAVRDAALGFAGAIARLQSIDDEIAALRSDL